MTSPRLRVLILCDFADNWSVHNRAKAIVKFAPQLDVTIRADAESPRQERRSLRFVRHSSKKISQRRVQQNPMPAIIADGDAFDVVHFNFSGGLTDYYDWIVTHRDRVLLTAVNERSYMAGFAVHLDRFRELMRTCRATSVSPKIADLCGAAYIPNGIDEDLFNKTRPRPVIGYAGTKSAGKNAQLVQEVCRDLGLEFRSAIYAGDTPNQPIPHDRMQDFYCGLDCYVHASASEGFNNTVLEALACNVPVIMTKSGAWQEFIGFADFIEPNLESIRNALRKFCGRRLVNEKFLWRNIVPKYVALYEEIAHANDRYSDAGAHPVSRSDAEVRADGPAGIAGL